MSQQKTSPARIFLLLSIIVSVGLILGLLSAIGKIGKINQPITVSPSASLISIPTIVISPSASATSTPSPIEKGIIISIDKIQYEQGEIVMIIIKNNLDSRMIIDWPYYTVEMSKNGTWQEIKRVFNPCGVKWKQFTPPFTISTNQELKYQWNQKEEWCDGAAKEISNSVVSGIYRIKTQISDENGSNGKAIYSNEFTIKEKTETVQDISIVLDKTEYQKGETVKGLFNFSKDIYINPNVSIYKFSNNDWKYLGAWSFSGVQYTCCGMMPTCAESFSKNSPVKFTWDQKVAKEELPILPSNPITKIQVDSGKYKISVVYGDKPVCIDGIDAEFIIK